MGNENAFSAAQKPQKEGVKGWIWTVSGKIACWDGNRCPWRKLLGHEEVISTVTGQLGQLVAPCPEEVAAGE
ncbi:MAG: hypothetical protein C4542_06130 [Dehalococcoidia bacterium]|nr:MAG: hypothetical protein C4542_06130 [Dehalococcoidia bacterium]